jgi:ribosomal protein S18 acetylase RimI-like enzyme
MTDSGLQIIPAGMSQLDHLVALSRQTFTETFAAENNPADMQQYLDGHLSKECLKAELKHPGASFYLAYRNEQPVGYLKVNEGDAQTELKAAGIMEIERIYVLKEFHGSGAGQQLLEKALKIAKDKKAVYIWLGVWEHNTRAIKFYEKHGFAAFDKHIFRLGADEQTDIMMKKVLA